MGRLSLVFGRKTGVIRRPLVVASLAEVRRLLMVTGRVVVVRGCLTMMLCGFRHLKIPSQRSACATGSSPRTTRVHQLFEIRLPGHRALLLPERTVTLFSVSICSKGDKGEGEHGAREEQIPI